MMSMSDFRLMNSSHNIAIHQTSYSLRLPLAGDRGRYAS